jgi:AraC-like DNA-binding protein/positive regulator of sigma E activity
MFTFELTLKPVQIITLLGILIAFLLSFLFVFTHKLRTKANIFLVLLMMSFSLNSLYYLVKDLGVHQTYHVLKYIHFSIPALIPVSAYFYVFYLRPIPDTKRFGWFEWFIFVPVVLDATYFISNGCRFYFLGEHSFNPSSIKLLNMLEEIMVMLCALTLLPYGIWLLRNYKKKLKETHSYIENISLSWLATMLMMYVGILVLWIPPYLGYIFTNTLSLSKFYPLWISSGIVACWIGAKGFLQPELFSFRPSKGEENIIQIKEIRLLPAHQEISPQEDLDKYMSREQSISHENLDKYIPQLTELIHKEKIFKDPELHSSELARRIGISNRLLTTILTQKLQTNFHDYINQARVKEIKEHLSHPDYQNYTVFGIALENGFNSKDAFHRNFKKHTGMTPAEYKKKNA